MILYCRFLTFLRQSVVEEEIVSELEGSCLTNFDPFDIQACDTSEHRLFIMEKIFIKP